MTWRYEYNEFGGYDCMTSSYDIYDDNDKFVCEIDTNTKDKSERCRKIAELIVNAINKEKTK